MTAAMLTREYRAQLDDTVEIITGRAWKAMCDEIIDRERMLGHGFGVGPMERDRLIAKAPDRVRYELRRANLRRDLEAVSPSFQAVTGQPAANPSSFSSVNTTNVETNLWTPNIWTPIPANDMQAGKVYQGNAGGILSTSSSAPTSTWTPRIGQSATPSSNVTMGATTGTTMIASLASVPWCWQFTWTVRSLGLAAGAATGTGNGYVVLGGLTTAAGIVQAMGATVATTIDNTTATGMILSQTWGTNSASNTLTCQWVAPVLSFN